MVTDSIDEGLQSLGKRVYHDATRGYSTDSEPASCSVSETRAEVIQQIFAWIDDEHQTSQVLCLYGGIGSGTTAIAQTVVDRCRLSKRLGASFFFRKGLRSRADGSRLFPAIAYQLAMNIPELRKPVNDIVCRDDSIPSQPICDQFQLLVVRPTQEFMPSLLQTHIIVIDGLDECDDSDGSQQDILRCITDSVGDLKLPLRFFITSRPESHVCNAFENDILNSLTVKISLQSLDTSIRQPSFHHPKSPSDVLASPSPKLRRPFKLPLRFPSFPPIVSVQQRNGHQESYCRSLLFTGNGFPIWKPLGNLHLPVEYLRKGVSIGDVGIMDADGSFQYFFNVFLPPNDPVNVRRTPREFRAIEPTLQPDEVVYEEEYFKQGHILVSGGITIERHSKTPLDVSFTSSEPEGAILVLPSGASRKDLLSTTRFYEYARQNAPHWYQFINSYSGVTEPNGTLFLVTGCDKAKDWATASFPYRPGNAGGPIHLQYSWEPDYKPPWSHSGTAATDFYAPVKKISTDRNEKNQCIFLRGLRISLTQQSWQKTLPYVEQAKRHYSLVLHTPSRFHLWVDSILVFLHLRLAEKRAVDIVTAKDQHLFHPNFIIAQILLAEYPEAEVALVEDSVWCALVKTVEGPYTISKINELLTEILRLNKIAEKNGVISLQPKTRDELEQRQDQPMTFKIFNRNLPLSCNSYGPSRTKRKSNQWVKRVPIYEHAKLF